MRTIGIALALLLALARPAVAQTCTTGDCGSWDWDFFGIPGLDNPQKEKIDALKMDFLRDSAMREIGLMQANAELAAALTAPRIDPAAIKQALAHKAQVTTDYSQRAIDMLVATKALLKPEQQRWLDKQMIMSPGEIAWFVIETLRSRSPGPSWGDNAGGGQQAGPQGRSPQGSQGPVPMPGQMPGPGAAMMPGAMPGTMPSPVPPPGAMGQGPMPGQGPMMQQQGPGCACGCDLGAAPAKTEAPKKKK
jgi:hypothetical protein